MSFTAKSIIIDIADNYGNDFLGLRAVDFWYEDSKLTFSTYDFTAYATTELGIGNAVEFIFDTSLGKTDSFTNRSWQAERYSNTNQRVICVFDTAITFDEIRINNSHYEGTNTNRGVKNVKIYTSTDTITSTIYNSTISNSTLVFDGVFDEHAAVNAEDEQTLSLIFPIAEFIFNGSGGAVVGSKAGLYFRPPPPYTGIGGAIAGGEGLKTFALMTKSVVIDVADVWNEASSAVGIRQVDFYLGNTLLPFTSDDYSADASSHYNDQVLPAFAFDTSLARTGTYAYTAWMANLVHSGRLIVIFNSPVHFDQIRITNFTGTSITDCDRGAKNIVVTRSPHAVTDTTYGTAIADGEVLFDGVLEKHVFSDILDEHIIYRPLPIFTGIGGAVAGGGAVFSQFTASAGIGGAVAGGGAVFSQFTASAGIGGAVAGGSAGIFTSSKVSIHQPLAVLSGVALSSSYAYGRIVSKIPTISGDTIKASISTGRLYASKILIAAQSGATGHIDSSLSTVSGSAVTDSIAQGKITSRLPAISILTGITGNIIASLPSVISMTSTDIICTGHIRSTRPELSGMLSIGNLFTGSLQSKAPTIHGLAVADEYVSGDINTPGMKVSGMAYSGCAAIGNVFPICSHIHGQCVRPEPTTIIKYRRGCSAT